MAGGVGFVVTDGTSRMSVVHTGSTPALFKTGTARAGGHLRADGAFHSDNMLVKHGEEYRPPARVRRPRPTR